MFCIAGSLLRPISAYPRKKVVNCDRDHTIPRKEKSTKVPHWGVFCFVLKPPLKSTDCLNGHYSRSTLLFCTELLCFVSLLVFQLMS